MFAPAEGAPVRGVELVAVPVTHDWTQRDLSGSRRTTVSDDGVFAFDEVKPGRYLLTVNVVSPPRVSRPFAPAYYPGVERREDAVVIETWRREYNEERPKKGLGGLTPAAFARQITKPSTVPAGL
jgi:hypothetical protein